MSLQNTKLPILLFDSECTLCQRFQKGLEKLDRNNTITYISIHSEAVKELTHHFDLSQSNELIHFINIDGQVYKGAEIAPVICQLIPAAKKLTWLLETEVGKKATSFFYKKLQELRESSLNSCPKCKKDKIN